MSKPGIPQGTRDFGAETVYKRSYILSTIREVFERCGYEPLETPSMENLDTLLGKYGEEGDKLIFKILNNGLDHPSKKESSLKAFNNLLEGKNDKEITERALRYDLTIPFARYVAMHQSEISFPFKRYQMQPVWRADRPQKGRYREFYQCDADVVGSRSLINEVELIQIYLTVFEKLGIDVEVHVNHRKILSGLAECCGGQAQTINITTAIDKLDKVGIEKIKEELTSKNLTEEQISIIERYLNIGGTNEEKIKVLPQLISNSYTQEGIKDLQYILNFFPVTPKKDEADYKPKSDIIFDLSLARGLNYYTGIIFEVRAKGVKIGSIGGGGRYDDLTGLFGLPGIPGVGISFGVDRIYDVMEELNLFPNTVQRSTQVLFFNLGEEAALKSFGIMQLLRDKNIRAELYHEQAKFEKQFKYAEKKNIPKIVIIGPDELITGTAKIKDLTSGVQTDVRFEELILKLRAEG
jgi:histidyl-tRNA synthetase